MWDESMNVGCEEEILIKLKSFLGPCCLQVFATPWTVACQAPLSMGFPRQECWSGLPFSL